MVVRRVHSNRVVRMEDANNDNIADPGSMQKILDLPGLGIHFTRIIEISLMTNCMLLWALILQRLC